MIDALRRALPDLEVGERDGSVTLRDGDAEHHFRLAVWRSGTPMPHQRGQTLLYLEDPTAAMIDEARRSGRQFASSVGQVSIRVPGLYVDIRPARGGAFQDRVRNPFSARGRLLCVSLLLQPDRIWTVIALAGATGLSQGFTSRVVTGLDELGLVARTSGGFRSEPEPLFVALAHAWPRASSFFAGRSPAPAEAVIGGGPAYEVHGLSIPDRPRAYVVDRAQLRTLAARTNAKPTASRTADWEAVVQPLAIANGVAPALICALELAGDARGREVLRAHKLVPYGIPA